MPRRKNGNLRFAKKGAGEVLYWLRRAPPKSPTELADKTDVTYGTVTQRLEEFEKAGYAEETKAAKGSYHLTQRGRRVADVLFPEIKKMFKEGKA